MSDSNTVSASLVLLTESSIGLTVDGPGWSLGPTTVKSARITPKTTNLVDIRNVSASDINGRAVYVDTNVHYKEFRKNNNAGTFASAQEVVDFINENGAPGSTGAAARELVQATGSQLVQPNQVVVMDNSTIVPSVSLPSVTAEDVGKDTLIFWTHPTLNDGSGRNCFISPAMGSGVAINGVVTGTAKYNTAAGPMTCVRAVVVGVDSWIVEAPDEVSEPFTPPPLG